MCLISGYFFTVVFFSFLYPSIRESCRALKLNPRNIKIKWNVAGNKSTAVIAFIIVLCQLSLPFKFDSF